MSTEHKETIYELEQMMETSKIVMQKHTALTRLMNNPDFREIILEGFCGSEAVRFVHASADPALNEQQQKDSLALAQASGHLKRWLNVQHQVGMQVSNEFGQLKEQLEELYTMAGEEV